MSAPRIIIKVEGLQALERNLAATGVKVSDLDFGGIAREGMRLAAIFAPKRSGALARSLRASKTKNRATIRAGSKAVPYAGPINYGWARRNIAASNFMQRADDVLRRTVPKELERQVQRIIAQRGLR